MTLSTFISALAKRGASEANVSAGSEIQICVNNEWRAQTANLTDAALDEMIARALPLDQEAAWHAPNGRASFSAQNYNIEASKVAGAVTIKLKRLAAKTSGGALNAQSASELKNSAFASINAFEPVAPPPPPSTLMPPTAATSPASWPAPAPVAPTNTVPPPIPNAMNEWFYCTLERVERGPFSLAQMRNFANMMTLTAQTLVWKEGMSQWLPVGQTELAQFLPQNQPNSYGAPGALPLSPFENRTHNDSGMSGAVLPDELKGFNSGAFFLPIFWCCSHGLAWIGVALFVAGFFIPFLPIGVAVGLGFMGNQMAWQNRAWANIEEFKNVQAIWARAGLYFLLAIAVVLFFIMIIASSSF